MFNKFFIRFNIFLKCQYLDCSRKYYNIIDLTTAASNTKCNTKSSFVLTSVLGYLYFLATGPLHGHLLWPWLLSLTPNLHLPAMAIKLYLTALSLSLYLLALTPSLYLMALARTLHLPQICIYLFNPACVCIYWPCLPNLYLLALAYDL